MAILASTMLPPSISWGAVTGIILLTLSKSTAKPESVPKSKTGASKPARAFYLVDDSNPPFCLSMGDKKDIFATFSLGLNCRVCCFK